MHDDATYLKANESKTKEEMLVADKAAETARNQVRIVLFVITANRTPFRKRSAIDTLAEPSGDRVAQIADRERFRVSIESQFGFCLFASCLTRLFSGTRVWLD